MFIIRDKVIGLFYNGVEDYGIEPKISVSFFNARLYDSYDEAYSYYEDFTHLDSSLVDKIEIVNISDRVLDTE